MSTCETCRYWGGRVSGRVYIPGPCRRYPPVMLSEQTKAYHPITHIADWCGEYAAKEQNHD